MTDSLIRTNVIPQMALYPTRQGAVWRGSRCSAWRVIMILLVAAVVTLNLQVMLGPDSQPHIGGEVVAEADCPRAVNITFALPPLSGTAALRQWDALPASQGRYLGLQRSSYGFLTIAIPIGTDPPDLEPRLSQTLDTLVKHTPGRHQLRSVVCLFLFTDADSATSRAVLQLVTSRYMLHINTGFLRVIQPPPGEHKTKMADMMASNTHRDTRGHIMNLTVSDSVAMHGYMYHHTVSANHTQYFLQYSYDVICSKHFIHDIERFVKEQVTEWALLEFSELDLVGKLLRTVDLHKVLHMLGLFHPEHPLPLLLPLFAVSMSQTTRRLYKPPLFESLSFADVVIKSNRMSAALLLPGSADKQWQSDDPPGVVVSSMRSDDSFPPRLAYGSESGFFWARAPRQGDWVKVIFQPPVIIERVIMETGSDIFPKDRLRSGTVALSGDHGCPERKEIGDVASGRVDVRGLSVQGPVACLVVNVGEDQDRWVVFQQIAVFTADSAALRRLDVRTRKPQFPPKLT